MSDRSDRFMLRAIELARRGFPAPNPRVGCVIVRDDHIVGEGWHDYMGGEHAEAAALSQAGLLAKGAEVYVTLEPCDHEGRTPPCSRALIEAKVASVTYACADPNPQAKGGGVRLRAHGIEVISGVQEAAAREVNSVFLFAHEQGRPLVLAKAAITLDGYLAKPDGTSQWITGESAREEGRRLRAEYGAVLVGRQTVESDNPRLTARRADVKNEPVRVVIDPHHKLLGSEEIFKGPGTCLRAVLGDAAGPGEVGVVAGADGSLCILDLLQKLRLHGVIGVVVEGGAMTLSHFFRQRLVDRLALFVAPKLFGKGIRWLDDVPSTNLQNVRSLRFGEDVEIVAEISGEPGT